jgi:hypothetical protein
LKPVAVWARPFDDPILLPGWARAGDSARCRRPHHEASEAEQDLEEWQVAVEALLLVVELNGPTMMARIDIMRALNCGYVREFNSSRNDTHWGRRKLKRDE